MSKDKEPYTGEKFQILARTPLILDSQQQKKFLSSISKLQRIDEEKIHDPNIEKELEKEFKREKKAASFPTIISLLKKNKFDRTKPEIKIISDYFCNNYNFFIKLLKESDQDKCMGLVGVLNLEKFEKGDKIIRYGEQGEKFYIILQGKVGVYKPKIVEKVMTLKEFVMNLWKLKHEEKDDLKLSRVEESNMKIANISLIRTVDYDWSKLNDLNIKKTYYEEINDFICFTEKGFEFGEVALRDRTARTATIIAQESCLIVSLDKYDYNHTMRKYDEKKANMIIEDFRKSFSLLNNWNKPIISKLYNSFSKVTLSLGEILYEQDSKAEDIYFVMNGCFESSTLINIPKFKKFEDYIINSKANLVSYLSKNTINLNDLEKIKSSLSQNVKPFQIDKSKSHVRLNYKLKKENLVDLKLAEEKLQESNDLIKVKLRNLNYRDILGLEEAIELKTRYSTVICVSTSAELMKLKIDDFVQLLNNFDIKLPEISAFVSERKNILLKQLRNYFEVRVISKNKMIQHQYSRFLSNMKEKDNGPMKLPKGMGIVTRDNTFNIPKNNSSNENNLLEGKKIYDTNIPSQEKVDNYYNNVSTSYLYFTLNSPNQNKSNIPKTHTRSASSICCNEKDDFPDYYRQTTETHSSHKKSRITSPMPAISSAKISQDRPKNSACSSFNKTNVNQANNLFKSLEERYFKNMMSYKNDLFYLKKESPDFDNPILISEIKKVVNPEFRLKSLHNSSHSKAFDGKLIKISSFSTSSNSSRVLTANFKHKTRNESKPNSIDSFTRITYELSKPQDLKKMSFFFNNTQDNSKRVIRSEVPLDIKMKDFKRLRKKKNKQLF
jgi:CRP-like cAMP-binding protein